MNPPTSPLYLAIFMGLQASGKSSFFRWHFGEPWVYVSKDLFRNAKNREQRQQRLVREALVARRNLVVDNTHPTVESRRPLLLLGHQYQAEIHGFYFSPNLSLSLQRNEQRSGKQCVPEVAIYTTFRSLQIPSPEEGFHQLYHVLPKEPFGFQVLSWEETPDTSQSNP